MFSAVTSSSLVDLVTQNRTPTNGIDTRTRARSDSNDDDDDDDDEFWMSWSELFESKTKQEEESIASSSPAVPIQAQAHAAVGLSNVPLEILQQCVEPVLKGLRQIDGEALLHLERTTEKEGGVRLDHG